MFERMLPISSPAPAAAEVQWIEESLILQQAALDFRREVEYRQQEEAYCQWYYEMVRQTRAEAAAMENDVDFFGWFCGTKLEES